MGSCFLTINAIIIAKKLSAPSQKTAKIEIINLLLLVGTLFGYLIILQVLGFIFSTFILLVASAKIFSAKWRSAFLLALSITITCYIIFIFWLHIPFPSSIFMR
jgi:membrane-associated HD superfamily phosphohydrolase